MRREQPDARSIPSKLWRCAHCLICTKLFRSNKKRLVYVRYAGLCRAVAHVFVFARSRTVGAIWQIRLNDPTTFCLKYDTGILSQRH